MQIKLTPAQVAILAPIKRQLDEAQAVFSLVIGAVVAGHADAPAGTQAKLEGDIVHLAIPEPQKEE